MLIRKLNAHITLSGRTEKKNIIIYFLYEMFRKCKSIEIESGLLVARG